MEKFEGGLEGGGGGFYRNGRVCYYFLSTKVSSRRVPSYLRFHAAILDVICPGTCSDTFFYDSGTFSML